MKNKTKAVFLVLCILMLACFSGCNKNQGATESTTAAPVTTAPTEATTAATEATTAATEGEEGTAYDFTSIGLSETLYLEAEEGKEGTVVLCEADITSKNEMKKQRFLDNFKLVRQKLKDLEEKDRIRNFQPPVDGAEIMEVFGLAPCREVGSLKSAIKDAILDGIIPNEHDAAFAFMLERAEKMGLKPKA